MKEKEKVMRKLTTLAAAAALFSTAMLASAPSQAITFGAPSGVRGAAETLTVIDKTACWRRGWHGWGWYRCWGGDPRWGWRHRWRRWY
jgi:hypothetical protein